ncbi:hypothetical protein [Rhizobium sp. BK060]|uniref:hypothetical protein n=1 Tax=Rhizobium sp. BK060 TaxID=2587096 RepID=UPI0016072411|nr:hypothetical protein [Rhizobium sp. BK060]MBB3399281.1 hypothetical protein [Rhizobium sp. BK060]
MRWKLFAILVAVSYVWAILTGFNGVPRSQFRMVGDACIGLFATIGVLLYAFERSCSASNFGRDFHDCTWFGFACGWQFSLSASQSFTARIPTCCPRKNGCSIVRLFGAFVELRFDSFQWLALARHAKGEMLK